MPARIQLAACIAIGVLVSSAQATSPKVDFNRQIKPILASNCFTCHGPDASQRKGGSDGLRLDTAEGALADLGGYAAIVPGDLHKSALVDRVTSSDPDEVMPPADTGKRLKSGEIELIKRWISEGANYKPHWSYVKPTRPAVPNVASKWPRNPIDHFLLARLEREGLKPSPEADRAALIRRLSLDLTGLPPTLEEVDAFLADIDPHAYEKLVDRLLAKPAYGEHWARLWLDLARYADSAGYADDGPRTIWLYRDYVIRAFNANKPFDQFTLEQLAGDLLPNPTEDQLIATAFHRNTTTNSEGGTDDEEFRNAAIVDRVNTTMAVWMGTTIACAQCHDHKYDPFTQQDYFRLFAFLNNTEDADRNDEAPVLPVYNDQQKAKRAELKSEVAKLEKVLETVTPEFNAGLARWADAFPIGMAWNVGKPSEVRLSSNVGVKVAEDSTVNVAQGAKNNTYFVEMPAPSTTLRAMRLDTLAGDNVPGGGPGYGEGNFVITAVNATIEPPADQTPRGRYVRIELTGTKKPLALAEVQVFSGTQNVATRGAAQQSTTDSAAQAKLAIDGNTDGRATAQSTSSTPVMERPWWEVDLGTEQPIDKIVVWNRTDQGKVEYLNHFRVRLLNERRSATWQKVVHEIPKPSVELSTKTSFPVIFDTALADYTQAGMDPGFVLQNPDEGYKGWAIGGQTGQSHALTLITPVPVEALPGSKLVFRIDHNTVFAHHCVASFRLSHTSDERAADYGRAPLDVLAALRKPAATRTADEQNRLAVYYRRISPELKPTRDKINELERQLAQIHPVTVPIMRERPANRHRVTKVQLRGNFMDTAQTVTEGTPAALPGLNADLSHDRLGLARWLMDENNPLPARVIANRYWEQIFGIGIVSTSEEFGSQGQLPEHPELLDWLASELVRLRWDAKAFLRLLVNSAAYRQSSHVDAALAKRDPENRLLARGPRLRLSAEMVRDQALQAAGLLSGKMYGPPVNPPQPSLGVSAAFGGKIDWQTSVGEDRYRRALYTTWRRSSPYPSMTTFDAPNRETCTIRRSTTNTPLQALVTLNDPVYVEAAQGLARRVALRAAEPAERARLAFRICLSRYPRDEELARFVALYQQAVAHFDAHPDDARRLATNPLGPPPAEVKVSELAALTAMSNVLLNLDEMLMKR